METETERRREWGSSPIPFLTMRFGGHQYRMFTTNYTWAGYDNYICHLL